MPSKTHKSPVVVGGGVSVVEEGWLVWRRSVAESEDGTPVDEGLSLDGVHNNPRGPQS